MIPQFNDDGYLPAGIHPATLDEVAERFGTESEIRRVQMESLRWLVEIAQVNVHYPGKAVRHVFTGFVYGLPCIS